MWHCFRSWLHSLAMTNLIICFSDWTKKKVTRQAGRQKKKKKKSISNIASIISRALTTAGIPSRLEPTGLLRTDGKRPDGMSLAPWSSGKLLVWDATCSDTFAPSHRSQATHAPGEVAARAEERKEAKYISLLAGHHFVPVAVETMGAPWVHEHCSF